MKNNTKKVFFRFFICLLGAIVLFSSACKGNETSESIEQEEYQVVETEKSGIDKNSVIGYLAKDEKTEYTIIYREDAGAAVKQGAKEIQDFVLATADTYIKVLSDASINYNESSKIISLGKTRALEKSSLTFDYTNMKSDGFYIKSENASVFIDGQTDRAILYGAYDFVEKVLGVKYLTPSYNYVPELDEIALYKMDVRENPWISDRAYSSRYSYTEMQYYSRMRMVSEFSNIPETYGGTIGWFNDASVLGNYVHNTLYYVQPELYAATNKDWFYIVDGEVIDLHYSNLGLNEDGTINESLDNSPVKVAIEKMKEFILISDPLDKYFMIGQMDVSHTCQCSACIEQETKYGRSGMNIRFVNAIAQAIEEWAKSNNITKEIYICTFAYQWSQRAPVKEDNGVLVALDPSVNPRDNVIVRIAPIQADLYYSLTDERQNEQTQELMTGWQVLLQGKKTMFWTYHTRFTFFMCYIPTMQHWQEDLLLYKEFGCEYLYMQGFHAEENDWKAECENYVAAKMMWNPNQDANALRDEFFTYYYRELADLVKEYNLNFEINAAKMVARGDAPNMTLQGKDEMLASKYYSTAFFEEQLGLIDEMYALVDTLDLSVSEHAEYTVMVDRLKLSAQFMLLYHYDDYYYNDAWGKNSMMKDFFDTCTKLQLRNWREFNGSLATLKTLFGYIE